jgi:hypothetical protein
MMFLRTEMSDVASTSGPSHSGDVYAETTTSAAAAAAQALAIRN